MAILVTQVVATLAISNVKTRGTWGEIQLENILKDTMQEGQYEKNVKLSQRSDDIVEFAIRIPSKEDEKQYLYLPIDSKFPADRYIGIVDAANSGDQARLAKAVGDLELRTCPQRRLERLRKQQLIKLTM